jgi:CPA1 family monovalent cation:H+ antiporter
MPGGELILGLLIAVAALVTLARRLRIAYPIFLVIGGLLLGLVPGVPRVPIDPDLIFLVVLPPLLYIAAFFTPIRSLRADLGVIASLAVGLVIVSACAVAVVARALIPGLPWAAALALGAVVAPPDALAATAITTRLAVPRRIVSILEGESLLNDATALTMYTVALAVVAGSVPSAAGALITFTAALVGGVAIGGAAGWIVAHIRARIEDTPVEMTISLLTPYAAFLPAVRLGASGVIATVAAGLFLGHRGSRIMGADARLTGRALWDTITFLLNGFVFIVMGLETPWLLRALTPSAAARYVGIGIVVTLVLLLVRALWIFGTVLLPERLRGALLPERLRGARDAPGAIACSVVLAWAGMRGVVSLAAALALPITLPGGAPFPAREALVVVTLTVTVTTLLGHGLTLPWLIRALGVGADAGLREEEGRARQRLVEAATRRIDQLYPVWPGHRPLLDQLRATHLHRSEHADRQRETSASDGEDRELIEHREIQRTVIDAEREALLRLRAEGEIDDEVLRHLERELDLDERRMDA